MAASAGSRVRTAGYRPLVCAVAAVAAVALLPNLDSPLRAQDSSWRFTEVSSEAGVRVAHANSGETMQDTIAGGVAAGDYDGDGWVDLFVVGGDLEEDRLLRNRGDGTFEDRTVDAGLATASSAHAGPSFADLDGDGWLDLWVGGIGQHVRIFRNLGNGTFEAVASTGLPFFDFSLGPAFGDVDGDGDLDAFVPQWNGEPADLLFRNDGDFTFVSMTDTAFDEQTVAALLYTFTPNFSDLDRDGDLDLLVASDFGWSQVLHNRGDGTFELATDEGVIKDENGMGAAVADFDRDGRLDWFVSSIWGATRVYGNRLYRGGGDGTFADATDEAGVADGGWGWGACFADLNHDGHLDLMHVNGWPQLHYATDASRVFVANGDGTFTDRAADLNLIDRRMGRGVVCLDYDRDGDLDLFVANNGEGSRLFRNDGGNDAPWLAVRLRGDEPNTEGVGARIEVVSASGVRWVHEMRRGSNFVSQNPAVAHFGLGASAMVTSVEVTWPDGRRSVLLGPASGREYEIEEGLIARSDFESGTQGGWQVRIDG